MPWYLYHALKQLFPSGRFFSSFSLMSITGVMLGVCVLIIVRSVMNGFGEGIRKRLTETQGDLRIYSDQIIYDWEVLVDMLSKQSEVIEAEPIAEGVVMLQYRNRPQFPFVRGIHPGRAGRVIPLHTFLISGNMDDLDDDGIFLGEGLADSLKVHEGSTVEVFTPLMPEALKNDEILLPREFKVLGLFRTGSPQVDGNTMITTLRVMQELYGLENGVHGLLLKLRPGQDAYDYGAFLKREILDTDLKVESWLESNKEFLFVLEQEKRVISFIIIFIILVASFSITIALMMAVIRKTREVGLLVAMGACPHQVAFGFCFQGFVIGLVGTVLGILFALLCLYYRSPILSLYMDIMNTQDGFLGQYDVYEIPIHYLASDFITVTGFAVSISTLAGLLPALRAARLKPADALRSE